MTGPLTIEVHAVRSLLRPHWWQVRACYRMWRLGRNARRRYEALPPEMRAAADVVSRQLENAVLFGRNAEERHDPPGA